MIIAKFKFPFKFDTARLESDLAKFADVAWTPHFNTAYYEGDWSGIALRAARDQAVELYPDPAATAFENTAAMRRCEYVPEIVEKFECDFETIRFLRLGAGAQIREHRDYKSGFEDGFARVHIPIVTNEKVAFRLGGENLRMRAGEAWYLNLNLPHSVRNDGEEDRVHLILDCVVNDWLRGIFENAAAR